MKHYSLDSSGNPVSIQYVDVPPIYRQDNIVDKSTFRPNAESVRLQSAGGASSGSLVYDETEPSDLEVSIRQGKFDKGEISKMQQLQKEEIDRQVDEVKKEKAEKQAKKISEARQDYLDSHLGFDSSTV